MIFTLREREREREMFTDREGELCYNLAGLLGGHCIASRRAAVAGVSRGRPANRRPQRDFLNNPSK
jgi:hypothetical protein